MMFAYQDEVVAVLKKSLEGADLPNLLFYGPPGTETTSTILAIARQLFGPEMMKARVLELKQMSEEYRIIEPLTSRCSKFRFKPLSTETLEKRLNMICEQEKVQCDNKAITYLQSAYRLKGDDTVEAEDITEIAGEIIAEGHAAAQIINQIHDRIVEMTELNDHQKSAIMEKIAIVDKCLCDGADEYLQILSLCSVMMQQFCHAGQT
ncbi:replication factor C subunit 4 [Desmophyllum pertusum]|uniref:Replication factor C subunit 4 n=1 Tax=Desmophyllum pertusum TaxID=174260 RepID=A0A9W9Z8K6_9CNID|nr:replication factor C subunit 4 [Desmophyllum pertusum]